MVVVERRYTESAHSPENRGDITRSISIFQIDGRERQKTNELLGSELRKNGNVTIGNGLLHACRFTIPILTKVGEGLSNEVTWEVKQYDLNSGEVRTVAQFFVKDTFESGNVYALPNGLLRAAGAVGQRKLVYRPYKKNEKSLNLSYSRLGSPAELIDVASFGRGFRVLVEAGGAAEETGLWYLEYDSVKRDKPSVEEKIGTLSQVLNAGFLNGSKGTPVFWVARGGGSFWQGAEVSIWVMDDEPRKEWSRSGEVVENVADIGVAGPCAGRYFVAQPERASEEDGRTAYGVNISRVGSGGEEVFRNSAAKVEKGLVLEATLAIGGDSVWMGVDYSKYEKERRKDGWYAWNGYKVVRLKERCE